MKKICECAAVEYGTSDRLMVLFSSKPAMRRDVFDYVTFVQGMPHTKLYLRDAHSDYLYHTGIEGLTNGIEETVEFLQYFIKKMGPKRVSFMGMSGGGFAASLFGHLVGADPATRIDDIHVQSSVSFVDPVKRDQIGGGERFPGMFQNLLDFLVSRNEEPKFIDVARIAEANPGAVRLMRMYYAEGDQTDSIQAQNMAGFDHVQAVPHPSHSHMMLGAALMREGTLYRDVENTVEALIEEAPTHAVPAPDKAPQNVGFAGMAGGGMGGQGNIGATA